MYDEEKAESFSTGDMQQLMNILHNLEEGEVVKGNVKDSWNRLTFADDNMVDYSELSEIHSRFPKLFQPAFMLQNQMMIHFMGEIWWSNKVHRLIMLLDDQPFLFITIYEFVALYLLTIIHNLHLTFCVL
jgi:hypothetical protein